MRALWFSLIVLAACTDEGKSPPPDGPSPDCGGGCGSPAKLEADRFTMDMGSVAVSSASPASIVTIRNSGIFESGTISAIVSGTDAGEFTVQNGCSTLPGRGTCVMSVVFKPTTAGMKTATLVASGSPGGTAMVAITAVATP